MIYDCCNASIFLFLVFWKSQSCWTSHRDSELKQTDNCIMKCTWNQRWPCHSRHLTRELLIQFTLGYFSTWWILYRTLTLNLELHMGHMIWRPSNWITWRYHMRRWHWRLKVKTNTILIYDFFHINYLN